MINYSPVIVTCMLCIISYVAMAKDREHWEVETKEKEAKIYALVLGILTIAASAFLCNRYAEYGIFHNLKRVSLLTIMWPIAYIDFKTYRIPNIFIVLGVIYRGILLGFELLSRSSNLRMVVTSEGIAAIAMFAATALCAVCIKNSIGSGDIKLFVLMGLMLGTEGIWNAVFLALIVSFIIAAVLLLTKRKGRKDFIPFGPAIAIGTYLSILLTGV